MVAVCSERSDRRERQLGAGYAIAAPLAARDTGGPLDGLPSQGRARGCTMQGQRSRQPPGASASRLFSDSIVAAVPHARVRGKHAPSTLGDDSSWANSVVVEGRADVRSSAPPGGCSGLRARRDSAAARPDQQRRQRGRRRLLRHAGDSPVRLQAAADQAGSKHTGDSRSRSKAGPSDGSLTAFGGRRRRQSRKWRDARRASSTEPRPAFVSSRVREVSAVVVTPSVRHQQRELRRCCFPACSLRTAG